jgi:replication initiation and membrane attachment protein
VSLYEPIIGADALALYLTLTNEASSLKQLNYPKFEISRLYKISSLDEKKFNEAIKKLESLRLVKSKLSRKTGSRKYEIFASLEPSEFFGNVLFEKTLVAKIGLENLEALKFLYKEKKDDEVEDDFEDVTAMFEDVFAEELEQIQTSPCVDDAEFNNLVSSKKTILEKMLDLNLLISLLKSQNIVLNYNSQKIKKTLN